jgi:hypothetical protein
LITVTRDIRELAQRAELEFHQRPHRFRRRAWLIGVGVALLCGGWLMWSAGTGDHRVFEAGPLSDAHAFIANDCRQCHTTWQPVRRLFNLGTSVATAENSSISNAACVKCHTAAEHNHRQIPAHASLSCAECHREHQGKTQLASVTDQHCIRCHGNLKTTDGPPTLFAQQINGFSAADGHPEFNLTRRLESDAAPSNLITLAELDALLKSDPAKGQYQQRFLDVLSLRSEHKPGESKWRDRGDIKFNHAAHLGPLGVKDRQGKTVVLTNNCQTCHVPDAAGRYMQPIQYQQHCASCHPLFFDNQNYAGDVVPHERPEIVRGFLTQKYTLTVLKQQQPLVDGVPPRPLPGQADRSPLSVDQSRRLEELVAQAERMAQDHTRVVKSRGGCKLCHTVGETGGDGLWTVQPPQIPNRWLPHSQFDHTAHRMLGCTECHHDVPQKRDTADVMLPTIADCRECHISASATASRGMLIGSMSKASRAHQLKSSCVLCHTYHRHTPEQPSGQLNKQLGVHLEPKPVAEMSPVGTGR